MVNATSFVPVDVQHFMNPQYLIMGSLVLFGVLGYFFIGFLSKERPEHEHRIIHMLIGITIGAATFFVLFSPLTFHAFNSTPTGAVTFNSYFIENCQPEYPVVQGMAILGIEETQSPKVPDQCDVVTPVNYLSGFILLAGVLVLLISMMMFLRHRV